MKIVRDLSVTAVARTQSVPWDMPWLSPITQANPQLVLDFVAGAYGIDGAPATLATAMTLTRSSSASHINAAGALASAGVDVPRIDHDPNSLAPLGLLLEQSRTNLLVQSDTPVSQSITVSAVQHTLSFYGAGTVTLSGAATGTFVGSGAFPARAEATFTPTAGSLTVTLSGTITSPQIEEGAVASSYVSTGASAVTRAEDVSSIGLGAWFGSSAGTLVFSGSITDAIANDRIVEIDAGDTSTRLSILWNTTLGKPQFQVWDGGSLQAAIAPGGNSVPLGSPFRVAVAYAGNDFVISLNGSSVVTDTLGSLPGGLTTMRLGRAIGGALGLLHAESVVYYPARLADAEVEALSS